jgi:hypothetical protein
MKHAIDPIQSNLVQANRASFTGAPTTPTSTRYLGIAALAIASLLSACGSAERTEADGTANDAAASAVQGLSVVELDEAAGKAVFKYEKDGRTITYDMRLGPPMLTPPSDESLKVDPELPSEEVDARVLDSNGAVFQLQMGGDSFIDPSWTMPHVEDIDEAGRLQDIRLMKDAEAAFRAIHIAPGLKALRQTGVQLAKAVETTPYKPGETLPTEAARVPGGLTPQSTVAVGPSSVRKWDFVIHKEQVHVLGIPVAADHSAVNLRGWSASGSIVFNADSCNHGPCARTMSTIHCVMPGFKTDDGTHSRYFYSGGCTTPYSWNSSSGHHNCNDDSELQGRAITQDRSQSTTGASCGSSADHYHAPGCSY